MTVTPLWDDACGYGQIVRRDADIYLIRSLFALGDANSTWNSPLSQVEWYWRWTQADRTDNFCPWHAWQELRSSSRSPVKLHWRIGLNEVSVLPWNVMLSFKSLFSIYSFCSTLLTLISHCLNFPDVVDLSSISRPFPTPCIRRPVITVTDR